MVKLRKKKLSEHKYSLYLDTYINGKRRYEFLKLYLTKDRDQNKEILRLAENIRAKKQLELQSLKYGFLPEFKKKINLIDYMHKVAEEKNHSNKSSFRNCIKYIVSFTNNFVMIMDINEIWLKEFEDYLSKYLSDNTAISYMQILKIALNSAVRDKLILTNPFLYFKISLKKHEAKKEFLTIEELQKLANAKCNDEEVKRVFLFGCYTGLRISDLRKLQWNDIKDDCIDFRQMKTSKMNYVPLSDTAKMILRYNRLNVINLESNNVFDLPSLPTILVKINEWVKNAGINKHITTHSARHTFATLSITHGVDLYTVSKLLGHCRVEVTQVYAKIVDQKKIEAVNKLPEIKIA